MTRTLFFLFVAATLVSCGSDGFKIKGFFPAAEDGTMVYMTKADENYTTVDSAVVKNGRFEFSGEGGGRTLRMLLAPSKAVGGPVVLEEGVTKVKIDNGLKRVGTDGNVILQRFMDAKEHLQALDYVTSPNYLKAFPVEQSMLDSLLVAREKARAAFSEYATIAFERNVDNELGYFIITRSYTLLDATQVEPLLAYVPEYLRDARYDIVHGYVSLRTKSIAQKRQTAVGRSYLNFELSEISDKKVLFSSVVEKNRYTLLQFWAGWCGPCRAELPAIDKLHKKFSGKGFAFVCVSLDTDAEEWRKAVFSLRLGGVQLCNPAGGSAEVASEYGVDAVPANVLVNGEGTIIARDLSPEELEKLLFDAFAG